MHLRIYRDATALAYQRGYADGERDARMSDAEFLDALAARIQSDDELREAVQAVIRQTITAIDAHAYRARIEKERGEAA